LSGGGMQDEKRSSPRVVTTIEIMFKEPRSLVKSYMLNISKGGIFVKTDEPMELDSVVNLKVKLSWEPYEMEIEGRVVWTNPKSRKNSFPRGMGIQFVKLKPEYKEKIDEFVEKYSKEIKDESIF
jgi:uncharacterized protein (TIGR02266 family)